jgi:hypothetical protein
VELRRNYKYGKVTISGKGGRFGPDGGRGYPPVGLAQGGEGDPHFEGKNGRGVGGTPSPTLSDPGPVLCRCLGMISCGVTTGLIEYPKAPGCFRKSGLYHRSKPDLKLEI